MSVPRAFCCPQVAAGIYQAGASHTQAVKNAVAWHLLSKIRAKLASQYAQGAANLWQISECSFDETEEVVFLGDEKGVRLSDSCTAILESRRALIIPTCTLRVGTHPFPSAVELKNRH